MAAPPVDPRIYYYLLNIKLNTTYGLGAGSPIDNGGKLRMNVLPKFSTNNWQFFYQDGVCFLRNYDYRPPNNEPSQLEAVDIAGTKSLRFKRASNTTGQQWTLSHWADGTWKFTNALVGSGLNLGIDPNTTEPAFTTDETWQHWVMAPNVDVATLPDDNQFPSFNVPNTTVTREAVSSVPTVTISSTTSPLTITPSPVCNPGITGGAIAGITIGGAVFGLLLASMVAFVLHRRQIQKFRPKNGKSPPPSELDARPISTPSNSIVW
ncbi:MAG: hypothetical protein M1812_001636 [Candelaria pacifica]|nr:MAG: hypothetical protein M1812_001636 [Candelaria pacifica]